MADYSDALRRLDAYRQRLGMSKTAMAQILGVHQNNYHEVEIGKRMISTDNLKSFEKNGGDLYYLLTGREQAPGPVDELFEQCKSQEQKELILNLLIANLELASWADGNPAGEISRQLKKTLRLFDEALAQYATLWLKIRKSEYLNQEKMAALLGVEKRQYRNIEKGKDPDWAILCELERNLHYSPMLFFDIKQYFLDELNYCWNQLTEESRVYVRKAITEALKI